jgi:hypothetical protein
MDFSQFLIQNKKLANEVNKGIKNDKELPFNEPLVLYNKVLGELEDKIVILKIGEGDNLKLEKDDDL